MNKPEFLPATFNKGKADAMPRIEALMLDSGIYRGTARYASEVARLRNLAGHLAVAAVHNARAKRRPM